MVLKIIIVILYPQQTYIIQLLRVMEYFVCRKPKNYFKDFLRVKRLMNIVLLQTTWKDGCKEGMGRGRREGETEKGRREGKKKIDWKSHFLF